METKAKKKTFNLIMVILIAVIAVCGIMATVHLRGGFAKKTDGQGLVCEKITGVVNVERSGVGYSLQADSVMQQDDLVETKKGSFVDFLLNGSNQISLGEQAVMEIPSCTEESLGLKMSQGECFAVVNDAPKEFEILLGGNTAKITGTVFSVSQQGNSSTISVYEGSVEVTAEDDAVYTVDAGNQLLVTHDETDAVVVETRAIQTASLSDLVISKLLACEVDSLCFGADELNDVVAAREKEEQEAAQALAGEAVSVSADGESADAAESTSGTNAGSEAEVTEDQAGSSGDSGNQTGGNASKESNGASGASNTDQSAANGNGNGSGASSDTSGESGSDEEVLTCTITIRCKAILSNMDKLAEGKDRYVPENGIILATTPVEFLDGETAYDVTKRACDAFGIQMEAAYTPVYGSYYVEGINHLYEFDCGEMSGWLYRVNGWTPNYGCSEYVLEDGDSIVWDYTCTGE